MKFFTTYRRRIYIRELKRVCVRVETGIIIYELIHSPETWLLLDHLYKRAVPLASSEPRAEPAQ